MLSTQNLIIEAKQAILREKLNQLHSCLRKEDLGEARRLSLITLECADALLKECGTTLQHLSGWAAPGESLGVSGPRQRSHRSS